MMTPVCPRLLNMITDFVLLRFWARASEDLSAIEVILLLLLSMISYGETPLVTAFYFLERYLYYNRVEMSCY